MKNTISLISRFQMDETYYFILFIAVSNYIMRKLFFLKKYTNTCIKSIEQLKKNVSYNER